MPNVQRVEIYGEIEAGTRIIFFKGCFVEVAAAIATALMPSGRRLDFVWYTMVAAAAKIMHHHCTARAQQKSSKTAEKRCDWGTCGYPVSHGVTPERTYHLFPSEHIMPW